MKTIHDYVPPDAASLRRLQERLGYSDAQMAELAGLDAAVPWSSYVGGPQPRALGQQRLLGMAARLTLDETAWQGVLAAMREAGARFDYGASDASTLTPAPAAPPAALEEHKFGMRLVSDRGAFHEMEQLREFAHHVQEFGVSDLVREARYDSAADLCRFTLASAREADAARRDRVFDAASRTITRFAFDGRVYQGGIPPESDD
ncbi:Uncharacterised protein [Achromobacter sp. 2789STDY5608615]|uniref:hypothetical protein n=1 Tax=Achromobacter sp. 2789STDY5608615 TaxID=1806492 RepID=UPI0006C46488|nr:hypothetical protein [Achromobacter sp. 2789STDY5608615]CUJ81242.1 Uncharacterised protein [Achromobacter sp. 2789STDY5608615]